MNLYNAAAVGNINLVNNIIKENIEVIDVDIMGAALYIASLNGHTEVVEMLVKAGANMEYTVNGKTPLYAAVYKGHEDVIDVLVNNGAMIRSNEHYDPLYIAGAINHTIYERIYSAHLNRIKKLNFNLEPIDPSMFEVVIVRYKENAETLAHMISVELPNVKVTVYNKGGGDLNLPPNCVVINIDNVGYLGGIYLYHIIMNYNDLANRVLFLQAESHYHEMFPRLLSYIENLNSTCKEIVGKCLPTTLIKESQSLENTDFSHGRYSKVTLKNYNLIEFANKLIGQYQPEQNISVCWGAQFAVDLEKIKYHDIIYYIVIFETMNSLLPIEDFFLERLWDLIFEKYSLNLDDLISNFLAIKEVPFPDGKTLFHLPNNKFFFVNSEDKFLNIFDVEAGLGHKPYIMKILQSYTRTGEVYVEIGANYGDFSIQMSDHVGNRGKIYAFEPGRKVFECLDLGVRLNGLSHIITTENLAVLDELQDVSFVETGVQGAGTLGSHVVSTNGISEQSNIIKATTIDVYFKNVESPIDILRFDVEGSECKVLKGASETISASPNIRIFVEWQRPLLNKYESEDSMKECLSNLKKNNFIFLDASHLNNGCNHSIFKLTSDDILMSNHLEILAIREDTLKEFEEINTDQSYCFSAMNYYLYLATNRGNLESVVNLISLGADPNSISGLGGQSFGATPLHIAAQKGDIEIARALLKVEVNLEKEASNELTALCVAVQNKHTDLVQLFINRNADTECVYPSGANALYVSSYLGDTKTAITLLKAGAKQDIIVDGKNIIDIANQGGYVETSRLFELGVDMFCEQTEDIQFAEVCGIIDITL